MYIKVLDPVFSVCKIKTLADIDFSDNFVFVGKTDEELSLVCTTSSVPKASISYESGWKCLRIEGVLGFSLTGVISKISTVLAEKHIPIFVVSTFNTDYVLVKLNHLEDTIYALKESGYELV